MPDGQPGARPRAREALPSARAAHLKRNAFEGEHFPDGSIKTIELCNFLTFEHTYIGSGPNLNLIIGPNGSGKSSIICGICLAVGGSPKLLGRSEVLTDYIKIGCQHGYAEITVADSKHDRGEARFRIYLQRSEKAPLYFLNDLKVSKQAVIMKAHNLNIQIENPCTFLPQDKVKGFAAQNPQELLKNTEKAGDVKLFEQHEEILTKKKEEKEFQKSVQDCESKLEQCKNQMILLEPKVEHYKKRKMMEVQRQKLEQKRVILAFEDAQAKYEAASEDTNEIKKQMADREKGQEKANRLLKKSTEQLEAVEEAEKLLGKAIAESVRKVNDNVDANWYINKMEDVKDRLATAREERQGWCKRVEKLEAECREIEERLEQERDKRGHYEKVLRDLSEQLRELTAGLDESADKVTRLEADNRELEAQLKDAESVQARNFANLERRMQTLPQYALTAYREYLQNKGRYKCPIYVPSVDITIRPGTANSLKVENSLNFRDRTTFIFGCKDDEMQMAKHHPKIATTVVEPPMIEQTLRHLADNALPDVAVQSGIVGTMLDLVDCPDAVRVFLTRGCLWDKIYIGNARVDERFYDVANVMKHQWPFGRIFTDHHQVSWSVSMYSHEVLVDQTRLTSAHQEFFKPLTTRYEQVDEQKIRRLRLQAKKLGDEKEGLLEERRTVNGERTKIRAKLQDTLRLQKDGSKLKSVLEDKQSELAMVQRIQPNVEALEREFKNIASESVKQAILRASRTTKQCKELGKLLLRRNVAIHRLAHVRERVEEAQSEADQARQWIRAKINELKEKERRIATEKAAFDEANREAFDDKLAVLNALPGTLGEIDDQIADEEARLNLIRGAGAGTIKDVERLEELKGEQREMEADRDSAIQRRALFDGELERLVLA
ncbi:unnamed protein product, partial [Mesorhabditis spiculigera]